MIKACEFCGSSFKPHHKHNRYCSRRCMWDSEILPVGTVINRWTVIGHKTIEGRTRLIVRCQCGTEGVRQNSGIKTGQSMSCGCRVTEVMARQSYTKTHGMSGSPEYRTFHAAKKRCTNPKDSRWPDYGGRGIEFRFTSFEQFFEMLGPKPSPKHSINRIDNDGHYEPGNVEWAADDVQRRNKRRRRWQKKPEEAWE